MVDIKDLRSEIATLVKEDIIQGGRRKKAPKSSSKQSKKQTVKKPIGFVWEYENDNGKISKKYQMIYSLKSANKILKLL